MIKVKVLIPFNDKYTGKQYKKGDTLEMTAKRINEINRTGSFIELVEEETITTTKTKK